MRSDWWVDFNDPVLIRLVEQALTRNFDLQAAAARLLQAEAEARIPDLTGMPAWFPAVTAVREEFHDAGLVLEDLAMLDVGMRERAMAAMVEAARTALDGE